MTYKLPPDRKSRNGARRLRELRSDDGWPIRSNNDDSTLRPGEYRLDSLPPEQAYAFTRLISARVRAQILERNGYTCQMCGAGAGDVDELNPTRTVRIHVGHIQDKSHGGTDALTNLRALCSNCNQGAKKVVYQFERSSNPSRSSIVQIRSVRPAAIAGLRW